MSWTSYKTKCAENTFWWTAWSWNAQILSCKVSKDRQVYVPFSPPNQWVICRVDYFHLFIIGHLTFLWFECNCCGSFLSTSRCLVLFLDLFWAFLYSCCFIVPCAFVFWLGNDAVLAFGGVRPYRLFTPDACATVRADRSHSSQWCSSHQMSPRRDPPRSASRDG